MKKIEKSNEDYKLNTSVLFLVFNRLDVTKRVFEAIKEAKPPRLYIASDGARENKENEFKKVDEIREYIISNIDWECEVKTLFRENNLGCGLAVSSAIDWFFGHEEMGIILEDDCLPNQSFFKFCEIMLHKYDSDDTVMHISGNNFVNKFFEMKESYYFSKYTHIWGWATWRNSWKKYEFDCKTFSSDCCDIFKTIQEQRHWKSVLKDMKLGEIDTWDYQWNFAVLANKGYSILPAKNLVENIGFGTDATHTKDIENTLANLKSEELVIDICPINITYYEEYDLLTFKNIFYMSIYQKILNRIKNLIKGI